MKTVVLVYSVWRFLGSVGINEWSRISWPWPPRVIAETGLHVEILHRRLRLGSIHTRLGVKLEVGIFRLISNAETIKHLDQGERWI